MKKLLPVIVCALVVMTYVACQKSAPDNYPCTNKSVYSDSSALLKFAASDSITPVMDSTGLLYQILDSGVGKRAMLSSSITVTYVGKLMGGSIFDSATNNKLQGAPIYNLIPGWQIGLTKISKGGHIKLLVPSTYAYGCTGYGPIGPDQPLYFDIYLLDIY